MLCTTTSELSSVYGLIEQCQLQLPWKSCSKGIILLIKFSMKTWISEGVFSHFYLLLGPKILSRLSHGGLQLWLGLHHPDVLGTPSLDGVGSIPVLIHQCQAKTPPMARDGILPGLGLGVLVTCRQVWWSSFVARIGGIWGTFPSFSPFPFCFPHFLPLPFFFPSFLFPSLPGFVLISGRRESATDLFNRLLLLTKE